jgi:hypothetical protein
MSMRWQTRIKFEQALKDLANTGEFRAAPVVMKLNDGLSVIDGNHRVTDLLTKTSALRRLSFCGLSMTPIALARTGPACWPRNLAAERCPPAVARKVWRQTIVAL